MAVTYRRTHVLLCATGWRRWATGIVALALIFTLAGCGDDDAAEPETPGDAVTHLLELVDDGKFAEEWEMLHPAQQAFVPQDLYAKCAKAKGLDRAELSDIEIVATGQEDWPVPGTNLKPPSAAVSTSFTVKMGALEDSKLDTFHMFNVDGRWRWILMDPEPFRAGRCPD